jgi:hypothetical protein
MIVIYCLVYALAGNLLINGLLHLMMGLLGKRFTQRPKMVTERQFEKVYQGRLFSSAVFNAVYRPRPRPGRAVRSDHGWLVHVRPHPGNRRAVRGHRGRNPVAVVEVRGHDLVA